MTVFIKVLNILTAINFNLKKTIQYLFRIFQTESDKLRLNEYEEEINLLRGNVHSMEEDINLLRRTVHSMEEENKKNSLVMEQMSKEIEKRTAEVEAANIIAIRLQVS